MLKDIVYFFKTVPVLWNYLAGRWYVCRNLDNATLQYITTTISDAVKYGKQDPKSDQATVGALEGLVAQANIELDLRKRRNGL